MTIHPPDVAPKTRAALVQVATAVINGGAELSAEAAAVLQAKWKSGASYSAEELIRAVVRVVPTTSGDRVRAYIDQERQAGKLERIPVGDSWRYRRRAKAS